MTGDGDLHLLELELDALAARLEPRERIKVVRQVAADLRNANARRIRRNLTPDGESMQARKPRDVSLRSRPLAQSSAKPSRRGKRMFQKAASARHLLKRASADQASVGFSGAAARIMRVHHYGLRDRVGREPGSPEASYPARPVIGMPAQDRALVLERVLGMVAFR